MKIKHLLLACAMLLSCSAMLTSCGPTNEPDTPLAVINPGGNGNATITPPSEDDPEAPSNPLVSDQFPAYSGNTYPSYSLFAREMGAKGNYGKGYFAFKSTDYIIDNGIFNCITTSSATAQRIADALTSGKWLSDEEPFPVEISRQGVVLFCEFNTLNGYNARTSPYTNIVDSWYKTIWAIPLNPHFGKSVTEDGGHTYRYTSDSLFGLPTTCVATTDEGTSGLNDFGNSVTIYTFIYKFKAPSCSMAQCLADLVSSFLSEGNDMRSSYSIDSTHVTVTTKSQYKPYVSGCTPEEYIMYLDAFTHQPLQSMLLQFGKIRY